MSQTSDQLLLWARTELPALRARLAETYAAIGAARKALNCESVAALR